MKSSKCTCDKCHNSGGETFAKISYHQILGKYLYLCPIYWNEYNLSLGVNESIEMDKSFIRDLKELLNKYNATIICDIYGDSHGPHKMFVDIDGKDYPLCDGQCIYVSDLK